MSKHIGCKHLDYEDHYVDCTLIIVEPEGWKYWRRDNPPYEGAPVKVQFCTKRGRINDVFSCINPGERCCFEPEEPAQ